MAKIAFLSALVLASFPLLSEASCVCRCVNGQVQAMCTNATEVPPVCGPEVCPVTPPTIEPIAAPQLRPLGTSECHEAQVLNPYSHQYEWKRVCS